MQVCAEHQESLIDEKRGNGRCELAAGVPGQRLDAARRFARFSRHLLTLTTAEAVEQLRSDIRERMVAAGFLQPDGRLIASQLDAEMGRYYRHSSFDVRLRTLAHDEHRASRAAHKLLSRERSQHPVPMILVAMFLGLDESQSDEAFATQHHDLDEGCQSKTELSQDTPHHSARTTEYGSRIRELLKKGYTPKRTASLLGIRVDRVYYQIRRDGLREGMTKLRVERKRAKERLTWVMALQRWPDRTTNYVRGRVPKVYRWLYRNDKDWLSHQGTGVRTWTSGEKSHGRPYGADAVLANRILAIGQSIREKRPERRCSRRCLVIGSGLTEATFGRALHWKRVARAMAQSEESIYAFRVRVLASRSKCEGTARCDDGVA